MLSSHTAPLLAAFLTWVTIATARVQVNVASLDLGSLVDVAVKVGGTFALCLILIQMIQKLIDRMLEESKATREAMAAQTAAIVANTNETKELRADLKDLSAFMRTIESRVTELEHADRRRGGRQG